MDFTIPTSVQEEHAELHGELVAATKAGGRTGDAAKAVAALLHPHFQKEEAYALPPLGLLAELAKGAATPEMREVLRLTDELRAELPTMLAEHQAIVGALHTLIDAATAENRTDIADFARSLMHHAMTEEQVMYPAALLVGEYVRLRLGASAG